MTGLYRTLPHSFAGCDLWQKLAISMASVFIAAGVVGHVLGIALGDPRAWLFHFLRIREETIVKATACYLQTSMENGVHFFTLSLG